MCCRISIVSIIRLKALYDNVKGPAEQQPGEPLYFGRDLL